jgi:MFS family permease
VATPADRPDDLAPAGRDLTSVAVTTASVAVILPALFFGASAVLFRAEIGLSESEVGLSISVFFGVSSLFATTGGRLAERFGPRQPLRISAFAAAFVMFAMGTFADDLVLVLAVMAIGGLAQGTAQPATNLALARATSARRGLLFGIKQSSIPLSSLIAGASVPLLGLTLGWRSTFLVGAACSGAIGLAMPRFPAGASVMRSRPDREGDIPLGPLVLVAFAGGAGSAAATALPAFFVESAVVAGIAVGTAGWLLMAGSVGCILSRLYVGWIADRIMRRPLLVVANMMVAGSIGFGLIATGVPGLVVAGVLVGFAFGWGWPGLYHFAMVHLNPNAPATAAGIGQAGASAGAAVGPLLFGLVVTRSSFNTAWLLATAVALVAATMMFVGRRWMRRARLRAGAIRR